MTIENNTEQANVTVGKILSQARERMGLTQEAVAERLCLKVSTVKEIEQDIHPAGVEPTFLRGYIRLYARMVSVTESEIQTFLKTDQPLQPSNVSPMQSYSLGKKTEKTRRLVNEAYLADCCCPNCNGRCLVVARL